MLLLMGRQGYIEKLKAKHKQKARPALPIAPKRHKQKTRNKTKSYTQVTTALEISKWQGAANAPNPSVPAAQPRIGASVKLPHH